MELKLSAFIQQANMELQALRPVFGNEPNWRTFGQSCKKVCENLLIVATAELVAFANDRAFSLALHDCAQTWHDYLALSRKKYGREPVLFYNTPLDAAVICQDQAQLTAIVNNMPEVHQPEEEYKTQFLTCWIKIRLATGKISEPSEALLADIDALEHHRVIPRDLDLAKALLGLDGLNETDFWQAFESAWYEHEQWLEERLADELSVKPSYMASRRFIWFAGLAWLKLAERYNFSSPARGYQYCPEEALSLQ